jgi:hypothetical protein
VPRFHLRQVSLRNAVFKVVNEHLFILFMKCDVTTLVTVASLVSCSVTHR